jgi:pyruvate dehydrogenase E2 component (dihydrolipoamide acetyltransferase)
METGEIISWEKNEGDTIKSGDVLCEVETDKAAMDYTSPTDGTLLKIIAPKGTQIKIGDPIAIVGQPGEDISQLLKEITVTKEEKREYLAGGAQQPEQKAPERIAAIVELPPKAEAKPELKKHPIITNGRVKASPLARRMAEQNGINLRELIGTGPDGRIIKRDVQAAIESKKAIEQALKKTKEELGAAAPPTPAMPAVAVTPTPGAHEIPVTGKRKVAAQRLSASKFTAPHYYLTVNVQMDELIHARDKLNQSLKDKISFNAFFIKLAAEALKRHPMVNATWKENTILQYGHSDIALAVAIPDGLVAPVIRNCGTKGIIAIDHEIRALVEKARNNTLKMEEITGATFTISNLGSYGIEEFTAIINPPGSAILAIGEMRRVPAVLENDRIDIITEMKMTLSCDHRVIDGAVGAQFISELRDMMENPVRALY